MECFAAYLSYTDQQIGRVLDFIADLGDADDTVVIVVSDNGASSEGGREGTINEGRLSNFEGSGVDEMYRRIDEIGGPLSHNNYPWGWTMAGNTPFKRWKRETHEGGVADPASSGSRRRGGPAEARSAGSTPTPSTSCPPCSSWSASTRPPRSTGSPSRTSTAPASPRCSVRTARTGPTGTAPSTSRYSGRGDLPRRLEGRHLPPGRARLRRRTAGQRTFEDDVGELYHVAEDASEAHDRAAELPEKVAELVSLWWEEAGRNDVLLLDNRVLQAVVHQHDRRRPQPTYRYFQGGAPVPEWVAADVRNRSHRIAVTVDVPDGVVPRGCSSPSAAPSAGGPCTSSTAGWVRAQPPQPPALHGHRRHGGRVGPPPPRVPVRQGQRRGGRASLVVDGRPAGEADIRRFAPVTFNEVGIGLTCGYEWGPRWGATTTRRSPSTAPSSAPR